MALILILGARGLIGRNLKAHLTMQGHEVRYFVREQRKADDITSFYWNYEREEVDIKAFRDVDYIINLSGANISKRWTFKYKKEIYDSRIMTLQFLYNILKKHQIRVKKIISVSGTGYYGDTLEQHCTETSATGKDFLAMVCRDWEDAANKFNEMKISTCILRLGVVMSLKGGFIPRIATPMRFFVGTHLGTGKQVVSWISLNDACRLFEHVIEKNLVGTYNATSSNPLSLEEIDNSIAQFYHRKIWLPNVPTKLVKLLLGEMSAIVLSSCWTDNNRIKNTGFTFQEEQFDHCLRY